ncbi:MAG: cyclic pyranopterin monophosphate synthase MoaC [Thermovirgaceae bacterium]|nr:cyclic pyranopterin monophosphate synthase MoaC [Synergistales bacterium]MDI9392013.1 cyclic pyranopterin monophosphate synthase MoaC [Synergistota bacterium]MDY0179519.1 cyclic pyranopterin monophosphate synthase MoaC [Synergistaceae bacterium]HRW88190.1 cyclic pyranopterin monophosphate synthase MoaC [Thermovirgaceae bacterium]MDD3133971.1 cyclic pyranopterin monophosphate synthase MoaC [Synergistales bacterium]
MSVFSHLDDSGRPVMVDVGKKKPTLREAEAEALVRLSRKVLDSMIEGKNAKGDVLRVAEIAGIMGAKRTPELVPLCHSIRLDHVSVVCELDEIEATARVRCTARGTEVTGVEMEAMTGVSVAALTLYDMCKGIDKGITIERIRLLRKSGGRSGEYRAEDRV